MPTIDYRAICESIEMYIAEHQESYHDEQDGYDDPDCYNCAWCDGALDVLRNVQAIIERFKGVE